MARLPSVHSRLTQMLRVSWRGRFRIDARSKVRGEGRHGLPYRSTTTNANDNEAFAEPMRLAA